ncbi:tetratricopeptide repeat protein [Corallococcus aberystwythensis]|uniref:Tetratricopeptide repeat protein n=1 Tax=Corallococcus aberystwythensis TaxID=2316722 RepID=A0A3A8QHY5_9BACT|nr:tetratricopeptide repeat protein [Corallococcus aberystwythensis]RKH65935.1 tetratricopeptide repeat protein [Corallococcus aberystwythensis]
MNALRAKALVEAGLLLRLSGDMAGAEKLFARALELDPGNARARRLLGRDGGPEQGADTGWNLAAPDLEADWGAWAGPSAPGPVEAPLRESVSLPEGTGMPGDALDLIAEAHRTQEFGLPDTFTPAGGLPEGSEVESLLRGAEDLLALDDHSGAVELLRRAQSLAPENPRVEALRDRSERILVSMLEARLGDLNRMPRVRLQPDDIIWLNLDHRAGFVLAQIDGAVSFDDLFALSGMSRLDTARILAQLLDEGIIAPGE